MGGGGGRAREKEDEWASTTHLVSSLRTSHHRHRLKSQLALVRRARHSVCDLLRNFTLDRRALCDRKRLKWRRPTHIVNRVKVKNSNFCYIKRNDKQASPMNAEIRIRLERERILSSLDMLRFSSVVKRRRHCLNFSFLIHFTLSQLHSAAARSFDLIKRKHGHNARSDYKFIL